MAIIARVWRRDERGNKRLEKDAVFTEWGKVGGWALLIALARAGGLGGDAAMILEIEEVSGVPGDDC